MQLGGWTRILIVLSIALAAMVAAMAYGSAPTREQTLSAWYGEASEVLSNRIRGTEGEYVSPSVVRSSYFNATEQENIDLLRTLAKGTTERSKLSAVEIRSVNAKYESELKNLTARKAAYWGKAFLIWVSVVLLLFLSGWSVGWVIRGFRKRAA